MKTITARATQPQTKNKVASAKLNAAKDARKSRRSHRSSRSPQRIDLLAELEKLPYSAAIGQTALAKYHDSLY